MKNKNKIIKAAFAAGCFWGVEEIFRKTNGVVKTTVGYMGGELNNPTYQQVSSGDTGHAETVLVEFNPNIVSYGELLNVFWSSHDPTTLNRQGPDIGSQYRSIIFYFDSDQEKIAEQSKKELQESSEFRNIIVTEVVPAKTFYTAEDYHQKYLQKRGKESCNI